MIFKNFSFLFFLIFNIALGQETVKIVDSLESSNPKYLVENWKQFYDKESSVEKKADILNIVSVAYQGLGDYHKMMEFLDKAEAEAKDSNNITFNLRIKRNRTYGLALLGRIDEAIAQSFDLLKLTYQIKDVTERKLFEAIVYSQIGTYIGEKGDKKKFFLYQKKALSILENLPKNRKVNEVLGNTYYNVGYNYLVDGNQTEEANKYFLKALETPDLTESLKAFIYSSLGDIAYQQNNIEQSYDYLNRALPYLEETQNIKLYETYNLLSVICRLKGDVQKSNEYRLKFNRLRDHLSQDQLTSINSSIEEIEAKRLTEEKKGRIEKIIWASAFFVLLGAGCIYFIRQKKYNKSQRKTYDELLEKIKTEEKLSNEIIKNERERESDNESDVEYVAESIPQENIINKKQNMSSEMEASLLKKLEKFERSTKFTDQNMSLASLAGIIGTNTQYLSELINKHKQKNFNAYINELRIKYVIKKLTEDKEYANFKIAYIAEDAGFSSHSVFSKVFKQYTDLSPSEFMTMHNQRQ